MAGIYWGIEKVKETAELPYPLTVENGEESRMREGRVSGNNRR